MKRLAAIFSSILILLLVGCASVPLAPMDRDLKAKAFLTTPDKASLYIYRNESFGSAIPMTVAINGKTLGQTAAKTYFYLTLPPGQYNVESHAENLINLLLTMESGKNYFVWQEVKMGMNIARCFLQQVDDTTGRAGVMESSMIATSVSENHISPLDAPVSKNDSVSQKLRELHNLRKDGIITEDEFQKKKQQLLEKL